MKLTNTLLVCLTAFALQVHGAAIAQDLDQSLLMRDARAKDLNTVRQFPEIATRAEWQARAREIREQVLMSCGLWPLPPKTPLNAKVFGRVERDGYSIEKVCLETLPGFYLGGNLYRPLGHAQGPFPAVLNPHGHWNDGRLADTKDGSIPARCISLARQGLIAFSYDMVGYNDTRFADTPTNQPFYVSHRQFATNRTDLLWNISLMGLQTWNSLRALDFLESLPDADRKRLACTGESGGGTQTFMLGAIDERLAAQAPVVMVSHLMQGGCLCENAPELRVEYSNMEIAAAAAPRPQILVAATGDWTRDTPTVEGPSIAHIYELFGAPQKFHYVQFDFGHNYNRTSREAVYSWFGQCLLNKRAGVPVKEAPYQKEPNEQLRVFADGKLPPGALTQAQVIAYLKQQHRAAWAGLVPRDRGGLKEFKETVLPAWQHTLQVEWPRSRVELELSDPQTEARWRTASVRLRRLGESGGLEGTYREPSALGAKGHPKLVVLCGGGSSGDEPALAARLLERGVSVLTITRFSSEPAGDQFTNFYSTYNRTVAQARVRDLLGLCSAAGSLALSKHAPFQVVLWGDREAGAWALLASPAADAVVADGRGLGFEDEHAWLEPGVFCPGLLNLGGFSGTALLAAPHPLLVYNPGDLANDKGLETAYRLSGAEAKLRLRATRPAEEELADWITSL